MTCEIGVDIKLPDGVAAGDVSDGYHSFNELYEYRKVYNAALFNEWARSGKFHVQKSLKHSDGELCFGGGWFIVVAETNHGQISNHYEVKDWDLFGCVSAVDIPMEYDGHSPKEALDRLIKVCEG